MTYCLVHVQTLSDVTQQNSATNYNFHSTIIKLILLQLPQTIMASHQCYVFLYFKFKKYFFVLKRCVCSTSERKVCVNLQCSSHSYLSVVVVGSAVLLLHIFSSGCEEGQRVEVLMGGLLPTCH